ncbi:MAG: dockerin type I domain-containing protein, partial [Planctomycetota bacterium]
AGVSNYGLRQVIPDLQEGPSSIEVFSNAENQTFEAWAWIAGIEAGDSLDVEWRRPDGTIFAADGTLYSEANRLQAWVGEFEIDQPDLGTWQARFLVNGQRIGQHKFEVRAIGEPEIRVNYRDTVVVNGRYTPFSLGEVQNSEEKLLPFLVNNDGSADLVLGDVKVPEGFVVRQKTRVPIPPNEVGIVILAMDTSVAPGYYGGQVLISSNDKDESTTRFPVEGRLTSPTVGSLRVGVRDHVVQPHDWTVGTVRIEAPRTTDLLVELSTESSGIITPDFVTIPAGELSAFFAVQASGFEESILAAVRATAVGHSPARFEILLQVTGSWQNSAVAADVDDNGVVSPLDALLVINELNERDISDESTGAITATSASPPPFLDVDGNGLISPLDALLVINDLSNSQAASASVVVDPYLSAWSQDEDDVSRSESKDDIWDALFSKLGEDELSA